MIFQLLVKNVCFRNFPAVFTRSGGVVTGGCTIKRSKCMPVSLQMLMELFDINSCVVDKNMSSSLSIKGEKNLTPKDQKRRRCY